MSLPEAALLCWLVLSLCPHWAALGMAWLKMRPPRASDRPAQPTSFPPLEVYVPVKGASEGSSGALRSLVEQTYPAYYVTFVLESLDDPGNNVVDDLCARHPHAGKVISGLSVSAAQKNHNLVEGTKRLRPATEILVFCDSTNAADPNWLARFTEPIRSRAAEVVTTFRAFAPQPETIGGLCQAIYAAFVLVLATLHPMPWGGATGIRRETFERLEVARAWSCTVVDDLILGNVLAKAGLKVLMEPAEILRSPIKDQTVSGFLSYLDRQILFPKWTNPNLWLQALCMHVNLTAAAVVSVVLTALSLAGLVSAVAGLTAGGFLVSLLAFALLLRRINPFSPSVEGWLISLLPCMLLAAFVFIRSVFRDYIDWHGRRYWPGKEGVVLRIDPITQRARDRSSR
ncbi:MAG: glycosyltransferase [Desulfomonile tiedjei]|nr:glycosyltransferase [Desulfomonile tiedjei]